MTPELLRQRLLTAFPEIQKGKYVGQGLAHDCDKNSFRSAKDYNLDIYVGFIMFFDKHYGWTCTGHCFNVENGLVVEMTDLSGDSFNWANCFYFGAKVPNRTPLKSLWDYSKPIPR